MECFWKSNKTNEIYKTKEECVKAEEAYDKKLLEEKIKKEEILARQEKLKKERKGRANEVQKAFDSANELLSKFIEDYGNYHIEFKTPNPFLYLNNFINDIFNNL